jgi:enolase
MPIKIAYLQAMEILDSRGRPTLSVVLGTADGIRTRAGVPSGASTGSGEAVELRDGDPARYAGAGVTKAVGHVNEEIFEALRNRSFADLAALDAVLIELDGTANKARLGANAIVGVSIAAARAFALHQNVALWQYLTPGGVTPRLPVPHFNVLNGGAHAANPLDFQEFMIAPIGARDLPEAVRTGAEVYGALRRQLAATGHSTGLGDEGGFAPEVAEPEYALRILADAIRDAGYPAGAGGVAIALDPAASGFRRADGTYLVNGQPLTSNEMIDRYAAILAQFPVWSIEDGLGEDDRDGWIRMTERLGTRAQLVGDDNFVTNPAVIRAAIDDKIANAALIKVNQIGTVTETLEALAVCRDAGYAAMISHRSGETDDTFIADLAVASGCGQLKTGAPARGERVAKYNRLLEIANTHPQLPYGLDKPAPPSAS